MTFYRLLELDGKGDSQSPFPGADAAAEKGDSQSPFPGADAAAEKGDKRATKGRQKGDWGGSALDKQEQEQVLPPNPPQAGGESQEPPGSQKRPRRLTRQQVAASAGTRKPETERETAAREAAEGRLERERWLTWLSMSDGFREANPWLGKRFDEDVGEVAREKRLEPVERRIGGERIAMVPGCTMGAELLEFQGFGGADQEYG
jgi:hypothetical protein